MPLPPLPPELKAIAPFLQRADEMRSKDPVISFWCEYYAVKKGLSLRQSSESRTFLLQLMDSLEATKKALADRDAINNDDAGHLYVENFADRIFIMADEEDRRGATARSTAKKFLAAGQFYDILSVFEGTKQTQGPKTSEKRTYAKWRATEISKAFRDNRTPPPPPSPTSHAVSPLPTASSLTDPSASQTLTPSSVSSLPPVGTSSTPPPPSARSPTAQSPTSGPTTITITSPGPASGTASPGGSGSGTPHRRRASDVSASTPTRLGTGASPAWSTRVQITPDPSTNGARQRESSPAKDKRLRRGLSSLSHRADRGLNGEDSSTDPGTEDDDSTAGSGGVNGSSKRLFNAQENGHEANGEGWSNGAGWDARHASLAVQPPESRQASFAQRPADVTLPVSPPATAPAPQILGSPTSSQFNNGPPALISGPVQPVQYGSAPSSQSSSRHTSPKSSEPAIPQTPGKQSSPISSHSTPGRASPSAPPPSVATPSSSHASITPTGSPSGTEDSPVTTPTSGPTITVSGQQPTSLVLPPRRVHFSGSTVGGLSSVASSEASSSPYSSPGHTPTELPPNHMPLQITGPPSNVSPTHSRHYEPTPRAPPAILPPPDLSPDIILPPLSSALVRPQSYQNPRAPLPSVAYPTASAPPYPEPTYSSPPPLVHHGQPHHHHQHSSSQSLVHVPQAQAQGGSGSGGYSYVPATPATPPLPLTISGSATQRAQKHAKFAISALDYDDLDTARKELMNALAIVNGRSL